LVLNTYIWDSLEEVKRARIGTLTVLGRRVIILEKDILYQRLLEGLEERVLRVECIKDRDIWKPSVNAETKQKSNKF
jgi:hypothetical protein